MALSKLSYGLSALLLATPAFSEEIESLTGGVSVTLWATSYNDGMVSSLQFAGGKLTKTGQTPDCGPQPTWLTLDKRSNKLYCLDEGWNDNQQGAHVTSFQTNRNGSLTTLKSIAALKSPVSSTLFGKNKLAVAHYDTGSLTTYDVSDPKDIKLYQKQAFTNPNPNPDPSSPQGIARQHDVILDPKGKFIASPDLGSDLIRIFAISPQDGKFVELEPAPVTRGAGPRHGAFATHGGNTYFYVVNELKNSITGFKATYGKRDCDLKLTKIVEVPVGGAGTSVPAGTSAAELEISPDGRFVLTSSRNEKSLDIPAYSGSGTIKSDPIYIHEIDPATGSLKFVQKAAAGGVNPRGFSLNKAGTLAAVGLQNDNRVVIIERDTKSGKLGNILSQATVGAGENNGPNYVLFDE